MLKIDFNETERSRPEELHRQLLQMVTSVAMSVWFMHVNTMT